MPDLVRFPSRMLVLAARSREGPSCAQNPCLARWKKFPLPTLLILVSVLLWPPFAETALGACIDRDGDGVPRGTECPAANDCDDGDLSRFPGAIEQCDGADDDCDGTVDNGCDGVCEESERRFGGRHLGSDDGYEQSLPELASALRGYGAAWENYTAGGATCSELRFARLRAGGELSHPATSLSVPGYPGNPRSSHTVEWNGKRFVVGWTANSSAACETSGGESSAVIQFLRPDGEPEGAAIHVRKPRPGWGSSMAGLSWNGELLVALVSDWEADDYKFVRIGDGGVVLDPDGLPLGLGGITTTIRPRMFSWTGDSYAVVFSAEGDSPVLPPDNFEIFLVRYDENFARLDAEPVRLTHSDSRSAEPSIVWAGGEWGIAWEQGFGSSGNSQIAFMRVGEDGQLLDPPGVVQLTIGTRDKTAPRIYWTGDEYGVIYREDTGGLANPAGDLFLIRMGPTGDLIESARLITDDAANEARSFAALWNGVDYTLLWEDSSGLPSKIRFDRMGCGCYDSDVDLFSSCAGGDCDDTRASVNLLGVEICWDGLDNDCDGLVDCSDSADCPVSGEVPSVAISLLADVDKLTFYWDPVPDATSHDVARGRLADLLFEGGVRHSECLAQGLTASEFVDPELPLRSDGFFYFVRGVAGSPSDCRKGSWGSATRDEDTGCQ